MAKIPIYEQTQTLPGKSGAVETPFVMDDAAKVMQETGKKVYWLSNDIKELAKKEKQEREMTEFAYARASLLKSWGESYAQLQESGDFTTMKDAWLKAKQKAFQDTRSQMTMDDAVREFDIWAEEAGVRMDLDVISLVADRRRDDTRAKMSFAIEEAVKVGDISQVKMLLDNTSSYSEQEKAKLLLSAGKDIEVNAIKTAIKADPFNYEIPDVSAFEYLDIDDVDALRQDQFTEQNVIKNQRAQEEEAIVGDILKKYETTGRLPSMTQLTALHEADPDTGLRKISNNTYMMFANMIKSQNKSGGPPKKPTISTKETLGKFNELMDETLDPNAEHLMALKLKIKNMGASGQITSDEESILTETLNLRLEKENALDFKVLDEESESFGATLEDFGDYFDLETIGAMKRDFWKHGTSLSAWRYSRSTYTRWTSRAIVCPGR